MEEENKNLPQEAEERQEGSITVKRNKTADFIAKIICLLLAFFLWYYAASLETVIFEEELTGIEVDIINRSEYSIVTGDGITVDLLLSGKRNDLRDATSSNVRAYVEIPEAITAGEHKLEVKYDIPGKLTLEKTSSEMITVYLDNTVTRMVEVRVNAFHYQLDRGELYIERLPDISLTGPEQLINSVEYAVLNIDLNDRLLTGNLSYTGELSLAGENGQEIENRNIRMGTTSATAKLSIYDEVDAPVLVKFKHGLVADSSYSLELSHRTIRVRGELNKVKDLTITVEIDEKTVKSGESKSYIFALPSGVENVENVAAVDAAVSFGNMIERELTVPVISSDSLTVSPDIRVRVRGEKHLVLSLTSSDIKAVANIEGETGETVSAEVQFVFLGQYNGKVYEVYNAGSPYRVEVTVGQ